MALLKNKKITLSISILMLFVLIVIILVPNSISRYKKTKAGDGDLEIAKFQVKLNNSTNLSQNINLKDTITTNSYSDDYVAPGTTGDIQLILDFANVDVSTDYNINLGTYDLPTNLKLYSDASFTTEFTSISGTFLINNTTTHTHHIYWKWEYATDTASNTNDNLYMNRNLSVSVVVTTSQKIGGGN